MSIWGCVVQEDTIGTLGNTLFSDNLISTAMKSYYYLTPFFSQGVLVNLESKVTYKMAQNNSTIPHARQS